MNNNYVGEVCVSYVGFSILGKYNVCDSTFLHACALSNYIKWFEGLLDIEDTDIDTRAVDRRPATVLPMPNTSMF